MVTKDEEEEEQLRAVALQNAQSINHARRRAEEALRKQSDWLRVTLSSIGDAVISTDADGRVTFMNGVAESLTAWTESEALGHSLSDVFHIVNEQSRQPVENPALRALQEGTIVGLANHTILIARDGTEWPIDDSAAPIRNEQSEVAGVVLVFRDITERKREEVAQAERTRLVALRADVSTALASGQATLTALQQCCDAVLRHLDVAFSGIWTLDDVDDELELQASAGLNTTLSGPPSRMPVGQGNIGRVASTRKPYLTNAVPDDPNVSNPEWAKREGMIAFAGYPLIVEYRMVGVVAMFARHPLTESVLTELAPLADGMAQYIDRRKAAEQFRQQAELHRVTLASIGDAVLTTDANGNVSYLNAVAQNLTGWKQEDAKGKPLTTVFNIINGQTHQPIENLVECVVREGKIVGLPNHTVLIAKDEREILIDESGAPITDHGGIVIGAVLVFRDITERKRSEVERERLLASAQSAQLEAEQANRLKDEFLATASHELRTPLNAVVGWSRMLRGGKLDQETSARALEAIERNAHLQTKLIEDLLDISRIITGKLNLDRRPIEMAYVVNDAVNTVRPAAEAKNITIETSFDLEAGPVLGDANRLQQVVWNLLSNAAKFTPRNGHVDVALRKVDSQIEISVRDSGEGIHPDFLPYVFERFRQADGTTTRKHGGLGLGLAIVRHLVELHGGTVKAHSDGLGRGALFSLRLPILGIHIGASSANSAGVSALTDAIVKEGLRIERSPKLDGVRVLIVDDDLDTRQLLEAVLTQCEAEVATVASAAEALQEIARQKPDVLVSDLGMPHQDGYELIKKVRDMEAAQNDIATPALALTAYAKAEDRVRSLAAGYQVHLSKPVEPAEFLLVVANLAGRGSTAT
ncbi:MAG: PAS domain S-box protein [Pyrinomonadaceae bacterium]|nr:PAS domain S-box protein [Pyrinomonadaceae bacterium]